MRRLLPNCRRWLAVSAFGNQRCRKNDCRECHRKNRAKNKLLAHRTLMFVFDWIGYRAGCQKNRDVGQSKKHDFPARCWPIKQRCEKHRYVGHCRYRKSDPRPSLAGIVGTNLDHKTEAYTRTRNPIGHVEWKSGLVLQSDAKRDKQSDAKER